MERKLALLQVINGSVGIKRVNSEFLVDLST